MRGTGELLLTLGMVLLLLVVYEVYVTDLWGNRKQAEATEVLDEVWAQAGPVEVTVPGASGSSDPSTSTSTSPEPPTAEKQVTDPAERTKKYDTEIGQGFAKIHIPSFGTDFSRTVIEGTDPDDLYVGPGHYQNTQYPGEPGNFAVAGHRVSKGSPFNDLDLLQSCDAIVVETRDDWFVYRVLPMQEEAAGWNPAARPQCAEVPQQRGSYANAFGRSIVLPTDGAVVNPVPGAASGAVPAQAERLITLTTCHPQFSDAERMIIHGILVESYSKATGFLPPELAAES